ncbi:MAG: segregation/condensation protein A [Rhizobiales bacterium 65-9]|nr:segregation/condensation protein A [Hyphomicrobiales bacterium]OJY35663.1 MAG: segregation/condensation protein A [Rhizobiales bacterium 65-9]
MANEFIDPDMFESDRGDTEPALIVDVDGFEGPLDVLLELARRQKVDIAKISILALAEQYLTFIEQARRMRLELAADYLVMASWLAYLKSRLLLPEKPGAEEPSAADLAADLAAKLRRLEAMRLAAKRLAERDQLGVHVFARGMPQSVVVQKTTEWQASVYDLLSAYARQRQKTALTSVSMKKRFVWSLVEAREALEKVVGRALDWTPLDAYLIEYLVEPSMRTTVTASAFVATLEMVREGMLDLRQDRAFAPLLVRARPPSSGQAMLREIVA